jgi:fatty-acyl-CoA synthase
MMDFPLTLPHLLDRAGFLFARSEMLSRCPRGTTTRSTYADFHRRARRIASALTKLGLQPGDRVSTMMWSHGTHVHLFFGIPCAGGIINPLNLRLHPQELAAIANHAGSRFLFVDDALLPVYESLRNAGARFEHVIVNRYAGGDVPPGFLDYDELLAAEGDDFSYPKLDENDGAAMFFTSGTTGCSKAVVYTHRSLVLHGLCLTTADSFALSHNDVVLPIVPLFHANSWGFPHAAAITGAKFVFLGPTLDPETILDAIVEHGVTFAAGVPTIWLNVLCALEKYPERWKFAPLRALCGGSAPPLDLIRALDKRGIHIMHAWGMTETSPLATAPLVKAHMHDYDEDDLYEIRGKQGLAVPFVELRIMRPEDPEDAQDENCEKTVEAPRDGKTPGELEIRGPWIAASYYNAPDQARRWTADGWFRTGDVANMDEEGYIKIVDREKDLVKSGGEWISSVDLENTLMGHPAVKEAAVIGVPHPKWQERPLAAVVLKDGAAVTPEELCAYLAQTFAKWQLPDAFVFMNEIPRTSVGKFKKTALRAQFAGWNWDPGAERCS